MYVYVWCTYLIKWLVCHRNCKYENLDWGNIVNNNKNAIFVAHTHAIYGS